MAKLAIVLLSSWLASGTALLAQATSVCPTNAVFLAVPNAVKGFPTKANGPTAPCQVITGASTTLTTANSVTVSINGYLHVLQFLTNGTVSVFLPNNTGNVAPNRIESVLNNDLVALATDRQVNDFVLSKRDGNAAISVTEPSTTRAEFSFVAPGFSIASALAVDKENNLIVGGWDTNNNAIIETLGTSASLGSPGVVRQLGGAATGIYAGDVPDFNNGLNTMSLATDPDNGELYVYTWSSGQAPKILVFKQGATGNVAPARIISGSTTRIGPPTEGNTNKIAVAADGRLFVSEPNGTILVFATGARGNVAPAQTIQDSTAGSASTAAGGIGVRSCTCNEPQPAAQ